MPAKPLILCDLPLQLDLLDTPGINVLRDGHYVSRTSDFIIYSVEAEYIHDVVAQYGPCE
jgi:prephenate dehydrogenase (NADP+)